MRLLQMLIAVCMLALPLHAPADEVATDSVISPEISAGTPRA